MRRKKDDVRIPPVLQQSDVDAMAKRRCLMLLSVLSGHTSITQALADAEISAGTFYALEKKALSAMLLALTPEATSTTTTLSSWQMVSKLEEKVKKLETENRRLERLLSLTKQVVKPGPMRSGGRRSKKRSTTLDKKKESDQASTPTSGGEDGH